MQDKDSTRSSINKRMNVVEQAGNSSKAERRNVRSFFGQKDRTNKGTRVKKFNSYAVEANYP